MKKNILLAAALTACSHQPDPEKITTAIDSACSACPGDTCQEITPYIQGRLKDGEYQSHGIVLYEEGRGTVYYPNTPGYIALTVTKKTSELSIHNTNGEQMRATSDGECIISNEKGDIIETTEEGIKNIVDNATK